MARKSPHGDGTPCIECGSTDTKKNGYNNTTTGRIPRRICNACGTRWDSREAKTIARCACGLLLEECDGHANWLGTADEILRSPRLNTPYTFNLNHFSK